MGLKFWKKFKSSTHENFANVKSKKIEQELEKEQQTMNKTIKLLMLGAGESGKSTIIKQMRIIHANGYTPENCGKYLPVILSNMMSYMITIIKVFCNKLKSILISLSGDGRTEHLLRKSQQWSSCRTVHVPRWNVD
jgi:hypothetical protein